MQTSITTTDLLSPAARCRARLPQSRVPQLGDGDGPEPSPASRRGYRAGQSRALAGSALGLLLSTAFCLFALADRSQAGEDAASTPISHVVELFTSQGCRTCPTAETVLSDLDADVERKAAQGVELVLGQRRVGGLVDRMGHRDQVIEQQGLGVPF